MKTLHLHKLQIDEHPNFVFRKLGIDNLDIREIKEGKIKIINMIMG